MESIRKISVGPDYKNAMHYQVGQVVLSSSYMIHLIKKNSTNGAVEVYIESPSTSEIFKWKEFSINVPVSIEYNIDFE